MAKSTTPIRDAVLVKYLNEAYGKEMQLETALKAQIALVSRPTLKKGLQDHLKVTKAQARGLKARIRALGGRAELGPDLPGPHVLTEAASGATAVANKAVAAAKGPIQALRGTSEADNELRNVRDCFWNEAEEIAHYQVIEAVASELGDQETVKLARQYRREEERMQALLAREIPKLVKLVVKEEVPRDQRPTAARARRRPAAKTTAAKSAATPTRSAASSSRRPAAKASTASRSTASGSSRAAASRPRARAAAKTAKPAAKPAARKAPAKK
jgi:ferritin-like metal-binding protein YciE